MSSSAMSGSAQQWRAPAVLQAKALASAIVAIAIVVVFFPLWIAVPVSVAFGVWGVGMCARRPSVLLDGEAGQLTVRMGPLTRRVAASQIDTVILERAKVTVGKTDGTAVSFYAWGKSRVDRWLKVPVVASDVAHAISKVAAAARRPEQEGAGFTRDRSGKNRPLIAVTAAGLLEIAAAFFVHVRWGSPVMTGLGAVVALAFGFTGMATVVFALWTFLAARSRRARATAA